MTKINVTPAFAATVAKLATAGKTPYLIINDDYAVGAYGTRNAARAAKAENKLEGKVVKASEVEVTVVDRAAKAAKPAKAGKASKPAQADSDVSVENTGDILRTSTVESPCFIVWDMADKMKGARRKDVIAACVAKGVAFYTARTQYQLWLTAKKADEANAAKSFK